MARAGGFTLVEVMVALAVLAVAATLGHQALRFLTGTEARLEPLRQRFTALETAFAVIDRDLLQLADRPIRDESGQSKPALVFGGGERGLVSFTRSGRDNPMSDPRSDLVRIDYRLDGERLLRDAWPTLDRVPGTAPVTLELLDGVRSARIRLRDDRGQWHEQAPLPPSNPPEASAPAPGSAPPARPALIEVRLTVAGLGELHRLIPVPK